MNETIDANPTNCRVLVVDDNRDGAESLALLLRLLGYDVTVAFDGRSGLSAARARRPDVAVLDIGLPGMNGFDLARELRTDAAFGRTRLIAASGYGQEADRQKCLAAGFDHHLTKPVDLADLRPLLGPVG